METVAPFQSTVNPHSQHKYKLPLTSGHESMDVRWSLPYRLGNPSENVIQDRMLVTCPISQTLPNPSPVKKGLSPKETATTFEVYSRSVKVKRETRKHLENQISPDRSGTQLLGFSKGSKSRLRFMAVNAADHIKSQFCMTYADDFPNDGRTCKGHLNGFLTVLRKRFDDLKYMWIGEFQTRGAPHFHLFSSLPVTAENHKILSDAWHKIAGVSEEKHRRFHNHSKNFIAWDMGTGSYLVKYLDKEHQKQIPEGFSNFGRWWGNSRNLKALPVNVVSVDEAHFYSDSANYETGEVFTDDVPQFLIRTLIKYQLKKGGKGWSVKRHQTMTSLFGAAIFNRVFDYQMTLAKRRYLK